MLCKLTEKKCTPCEGGVKPLKGEELKKLFKELPKGWVLINDHEIQKEYKYPDFRQALAFVNRVGELAEQEGHHPDIFLTWGLVKMTLWTHSIDGLSENDFILAAKIDEDITRVPNQTAY